MLGKNRIWTYTIAINFEILSKLVQKSIRSFSINKQLPMNQFLQFASKGRLSDDRIRKARQLNISLGELRTKTALRRNPKNASLSPFWYGGRIKGS